MTNNIKIIIIFSYFFFLRIHLNKEKYKTFKNINNKSQIEINLNNKNTTFGIISYPCKYCGLFSIFNKNLKCILSTIEKGIIPIVDLTSESNIFNKFNKISLKKNPWEIYFNQPFGYTLNDIKNNSKNIIKIKCNRFYSPHFDIIYNNIIFQDYWRNMAEKYVPVKKKIIIQAEKIKLKLFGISTNILGILMRGTDFIALKPKFHFIPPTCKIVFKDVIKLDKKYNYDYFFITTEDKIIRENFIYKFKEKIKYFSGKNDIKYDFRNKNLLGESRSIKGNFQFMKEYLINIIILSKCLDILSAKTNGAVGAFIFSKGFRFSKVYDLGSYK